MTEENKLQSKTRQEAWIQRQWRYQGINGDGFQTFSG